MVDIIKSYTTEYKGVDLLGITWHFSLSLSMIFLPKMFILYLNEDPFEYALQIGFNSSLLYIFTLKNYIF